MNQEKLDECLKALEAAGLIQSELKKAKRGPSSTHYKYIGAVK